MGFLLWIVAIILVVWGVMNLLAGAVLFGVVLIIVGVVIGGWGPVGSRY